MIAEKGNKVYTIDENSKSYYEGRGFDIKDDSGNIISNGKGKTVPYEEYQRVVKELEKTKAEQDSNKEDRFSEMSIEELKVFAEANEISIGNASSRTGIAKKIREALGEL